MPQVTVHEPARLSGILVSRLGKPRGGRALLWNAAYIAAYAVVMALLILGTIFGFAALEAMTT